MNSERPWLNSYPDGVPADIDADEFRSVVAVFAASLERFGDRPAYRNFGKTLTYAQADTLMGRFAAWLVGEIKLKRGDRVALMIPNCLQHPIATFGILRAGLTVVNVNPLYTARELHHQLVDSGAVALVVMDNFGHTVEQALNGTQVKHVVTTGLGDLLGVKGHIINFVLKYIKKMVPEYHLPAAIRFTDVLAAGQHHPVPEVDICPDDPAFLQYTGGTTGIAKGAMLTHRNMVANMQQTSSWVGNSGLRPGQEVVITALPLYHIFSLTANGLLFMKLGGLNHLITNPRDLPGFVKELKSNHFTVIIGVNTLFNGLLNTPGFAQLDFSDLKISLAGGMAVQRAVAERWKQVTGNTLTEGYGLTEASPVICVNRLDLPDFNGSIGLPVPSTEVSIQDENGQHLPIGEVGELCARGPQIMPGYWQRPEETAQVLTPDGWLHTGDMARMDANGFVYIVDRKKDMILVSGFNVYPNEVEDVLAMMPKVLEVAAIGVPDEKSGEAVKVVIVKKDPSLSAEEVIHHAREHLTGYKCPRIVEFRNELPKTNVGKILRRELRNPGAIK